MGGGSTGSLEAVRRVNFIHEIFDHPIKCRITKDGANCTRFFNTTRGRASHEWRCKGPYDLVMANMHKISVPKLVFDIDTR